MIRYTGVVLYTDGRREPWETGIRGARAWEAYAARHDLPLNPTPDTIDRFPVASWRLVLAHFALSVELGVDAWAETVDDIELEATELPPTPQAPPAGYALSSPSRSDGASSE